MSDIPTSGSTNAETSNDVESGTIFTQVRRSQRKGITFFANLM